MSTEYRLSAGFASRINISDQQRCEGSDLSVRMRYGNEHACTSHVLNKYIAIGVLEQKREEMLNCGIDGWILRPIDCGSSCLELPMSPNDKKTKAVAGNRVVGRTHSFPYHNRLSPLILSPSCPLNHFKNKPQKFSTLNTRLLHFLLS